MTSSLTTPTPRRLCGIATPTPSPLGRGGHLAGQCAGQRLDYGYLINTTIVTIAK